MLDHFTDDAEEGWGLRDRFQLTSTNYCAFIGEIYIKSQFFWELVFTLCLVNWNIIQSRMASRVILFCMIFKFPELLTIDVDGNWQLFITA